MDYRDQLHQKVKESSLRQKTGRKEGIPRDEFRVLRNQQKGEEGEDLSHLFHVQISRGEKNEKNEEKEKKDLRRRWAMREGISMLPSLLMFEFKDIKERLCLHIYIYISLP